MSSPPSQAASSLDDYRPFFDAVATLGVEFVVIGGCAVGAYARLLGETVLSNDLDLLITRSALELVLDASASLGASVISLVQPRAVPVAVLSWSGREINLLTATEGLAAPDVEARSAREFRFEDPKGTAVLIADPFDLLRNKLAIRRGKDMPHIALLRRFIDAEVIHGFTHEEVPRARIEAAERLLEVLGAHVLEAELAARLVPLARLAADYRFLAHRLPTAELVTELAARAPTAELREIVERISHRRGLR